MSNLLIFKIACRYIKAKCDNKFISFLSLFSVTATALGVAVLITVMSVMNGFDYEIKNLVMASDSHLIITDSSSYINDWKSIASKIKTYKDVTEIEPSVELQSLLNKDRNLIPVLVSGASKDKIKKYYPKLQEKKFGIILTDNYALKLDVEIGDDVLLVTPVLKSSITGVQPTMRKFKVIDIIADNKFLPKQIVRMQDLQTLLGIGNRVSNINVKMANLDAGPYLAHELRHNQSFYYNVSSWADRYAQLFKALRLQKTMMFLILLLIIVIAAFNMLSSMVMLVTDKQNSIAVLRTLGMQKRHITSIFMIQGIIIGIIGIIFGTMLGIIISYNVTNIVSFIEQILGYKLIDKAVYMLDYLPVKINISDVITINATALSLSIIATIYPALKAASIKPGKVLKGVL